jgi:hypothetical protein
MDCPEKAGIFGEIHILMTLSIKKIEIYSLIGKSRQMYTHRYFEEMATTFEIVFVRLNFS